MGLLEKLFGKRKKETEEQVVYQNSVNENVLINDNNSFQETIRGFVSANKMQIDNNVLNTLRQRYIAFDVETTGLSPYNDRIIEIGAVVFEKGIPVRRYGTLVNAMVNIPSTASAINHITNQMIKNAPTEKEVYADLVNFLGDALEEKTVICAHNAKFDMDFLSETLMRLGYNAKVNYIDTLSLSRKLVKGLVNYKQDTVATHFDLHNTKAHRAESDAEICGSILGKLLEIMEKNQETNRVAMEKSKPSEEEMEVCAVIYNIISSRKGNTDLLGFYKNNSGYVDVYYLYSIIKFKFAKKGKYIIVAKDLEGIEKYTKEPCTMSEGGSDFVRLFFNSPFDLEILGDYIFDEYKAVQKSADEYLEYNRSYLFEYRNGAIMNNALSATDVKNILSSMRNKDYQNVIINTEIDIDREAVEIYPVNNRVSISEIMNLNNWDKGFDKGYPLWEQGEEYRKSGRLQEAIMLYDKARFYGYCAPALFESYAMAFHKLKDYDNEIDILDEGIEREGKQGTNISRMITRRNNAIKMLLKQREKEQKSKEKEENSKVKAENSELGNRKYTKKQVGRPVLQMDDDKNIIERYESIAEAVRKTGIDSKCIRDASKGVQKHAGGFVWRYADEYEIE